MKMNFCMDRARILFIFVLCIVEVLGPYTSSCSTSPTIQNGYVSSSTSYSVTYSCNTGYQLLGSATAICVMEENYLVFWNSVPTCIAVNCNSSPSISNGSPGTPTSTTFGGTVTYSCNTGYILSGSATVRCGASGNWSTVPTCTSVPCGNPPTIPNGSRTFTGTTFGDTATYTCNTGYQLSGSSTVTCQASGSWSTAPTCLAICGSPPSISNGSPGTPTSIIQGGTVVYRCNTGYQLLGSATVVCQDSGNWSPRPNCLAICDLLPSISNGSPGTPTSTIAGGTVTYICNNGYQLSGSPTVTCQANGSWSARPSCSPVSCGNPPTIPNGSRTFTGTTFGVTALYTCNTGYQRSGLSIVTCQASRSWSTRPTCTIIPCGNPPTIPNGSRIFMGTTFGDTTTYTCDDGYQSSGLPTVTCQANGSWSARPSCSPVSCGNPPTIPNGSRIFMGTTFGDTTTYTCDDGYQSSGSSTVTCQANGSWSARPSCSPVSCGNPPTIPNGSRTFTGTTFGVTATYTCNTGYRRSGLSIVTCQASRSWSARPTCTIIPCGNPPTIPNGSRTFMGTTFGDTTTYTCDDGYQSSGSFTVTCQASGSWSAVPTCTTISCGNPPTIPNGFGTFMGTTFGDTTTYTCNTGYQSSGLPTVTCQANGSWSARPTCTSISCDNPPTIPNGSMTFMGTTFGDTALYTCNTGYQHSGSSTVTCQASGSWSTAPTCPPVPCGDPPTIPNGSRTFTGTKFGETVTYICDDGYQRSGSATVTCHASGSWSTRPTCKSICPPLTLVNGVVAYLPSSSIILEGTIAQHSCNIGYRLSGNGTRICNNNGTAGVWSLPNSSCRVTPEVIHVEVVALGSPVFSKNLSLLCSVHEVEIFQPTIVYKWLKNDEQLASNINMFTLSFDTLTLSDEAEYRCEVTLSSSLLSHDVQVISGSYELTFESLIVQLRFSGIHECKQYAASETAHKTDDITTKLVQGVIASCNCGFNSTFLSNAFLKCFADSPQHVTYRATLLSSSDLSTSEVLEYIEKWICSTSSVIIQNLNLNLNSTCPTVIVDFSSLECPVQVPVSVLDNTAVITSSVMAIVIFMLVLFVVFIAFVFVIKRRRSKIANNRDSSETTSNRNVNTTETIMINFPTIPRPRVGVPSLPAEYEVPKATADPEYDEVGPPVVKGRKNQYSFDVGPCPAYRQTTLKKTSH